MHRLSWSELSCWVARWESFRTTAWCHLLIVYHEFIRSLNFYNILSTMHPPLHDNLKHKWLIRRWSLHYGDVWGTAPRKTARPCRIATGKISIPWSDYVRKLSAALSPRVPTSADSHWRTSIEWVIPMVWVVAQNSGGIPSCRKLQERAWLRMVLYIPLCVSFRWNAFRPRILSLMKSIGSVGKLVPHWLDTGENITSAAFFRFECSCKKTDSYFFSFGRMVIDKYRFIESSGEGGESNPCYKPLYDETIDAPVRHKVSIDGAVTEKTGLQSRARTNRMTVGSAINFLGQTFDADAVDTKEDEKSYWGMIK